MITLTFGFDKDKLKKAGCTEDELLQQMREHAQKYDIPEVQYGVFSKEGEHALCELTMIIPQITRKQPNFIDFLSEWTLDVDGEKEDCIKETRKWYSKHKLQEALG